VPFLGLHDVGRFLGEPGATPEGLKLAFTFLLTTRGTPLIYYGDEIGMRGGGDPDNRRDFPGGWPGDSRNAFNFAGRTPEEAAIHAHVKKLLALRRELEPLRRGAVAELTATHDTYAFARTTAKNSAFVAINNSPQPRRFDLAMPSAWATRPRELTDRLGELGKVQFAGGRCVFTLPAKTAAILTASPTDIAAGSANEASP
jgi:glycosidase